MIIPFLDGLFVPFRKAPLTWVLVFMNVFVFLTFSRLQENSQKELVKFLDDDLFIVTQGTVFAQFLERHPGDDSPIVRNLAQKASATGSLESLRGLGQLAFRHTDFMLHGLGEAYSGDEVAINRWRKQAEKVLAIQEKHVSYRLGVSPLSEGYSSWITYQFIHGNFAHLMTNMAFLLMVGGAFETAIGSALFLFVYLVSGFLGAGAFLALSGSSAVPLVGASGAVSGLMGAFIAMNWKKSIRFFYILMPAQKYWGFLYLPAWVALGFWLLPDLAGLIGTLSETGGVAHATHLGGFGFGVVIGAIVFAWNRTKNSSSETEKQDPEVSKAA